MKETKPSEEAVSCVECEQLQNDNGIMRCLMYDGAMIEEVSEKNCIDSIR